ncbi:DUF3857 domain-containing protein [Pedobacter caeni]|uniref:Transglutaminase-like superfamily protein n=1 Tax=Pedobacter caeni TaxID=288992 RepID=A0A1M4X2Q1_9SPHI|nr:DUF3857 domain-containing protein [Pedobacter caeni]SHE87755.1 Transglutaminase-like superfamily protein [Pedobacter caeni]
MIRNLLLLLLVSVATPGFSQLEYAAENVPSNLRSRANSVIREMETMVDMRATDQVIMTVKKVVTVLNKNGDSDAGLTLYYDKSSSIQRIRGQILDAAGNVNTKFTQSNFSDHSAVSDGSLFIDFRLKHYSPVVTVYPYTIIYEYEIKNKQNLIIPDWYPSTSTDQSVEKSKYTFISKPTDEIRIREYNYQGKPEIQKTEKTVSYTWQVSSKPAFKSEPYAPDPDQYLTYVKVAARQFSYYGYKGSYQNWEELGKWVYNDLLKSRQALPESTVQEIKELTKGIESDREKAKRIYEYVQKKTRYISVQIGIGGFQPMQATEVQQLSYGDCKALVNYTQSLLKAADIPSIYCQVNAGRLKKSMDPDFAGMDQGNHIILAVPLKTDTVWLECTSSDSPFGFLGGFTDDRTVLACTAEGGKLLKTPKLSTDMNLLHRKVSMKVDAQGTVTGKLNTTFSGAQYDNYQNIISEPHTEQLKLLKEKYDVDNINFKDFKLLQDKGDQPNIKESFTLDIQKYAAKSNDLFYLELNAFNKTRSIPELRKRTLPVYINRGYTDEDELSYELPEGFKVEAKPENELISSIFGTYSSSVKIEGKTLVYKRRLQLKDGNYPAEKYGEFSTFMSNVHIADRAKLVYKLNQAAN